MENLYSIGRELGELSAKTTDHEHRITKLEGIVKTAKHCDDGPMQGGEVGRDTDGDGLCPCPGRPQDALAARPPFRGPSGLAGVSLVRSWVGLRWR